jgi:hypothetical protein
MRGILMSHDLQREVRKYIEIMRRVLGGKR